MNIPQFGKVPDIGSRIADGAGLFVLCLLFGGGVAGAQSLSVLPVNLVLPPGVLATTVRVINQGDKETSIQARVLSWNQTDDGEDVAPSDDVAVSPPIATIAPGATQVLRLSLRRAPDGKEGAYRILLDQIPPPSDLGPVSIALRISIPMFVEPVAPAGPHLEFQVQFRNGQAALVVINTGSCHERVHDIALTDGAGSLFRTAANETRYVLAGATGRWPIDPQGRLPEPGGELRLTGLTDAGAFDRAVLVVARP